MVNLRLAFVQGRRSLVLDGGSAPCHPERPHSGGGGCGCSSDGVETFGSPDGSGKVTTVMQRRVDGLSVIGAMFPCGVWVTQMGSGVDLLRI